MEQQAQEPVVTLRERKQLLSRVQELGTTEHAEIFRMLCEGGVEHMQNNYGVFVNLARVSDAVMRQVQDFVNFCLDNKQDLDEYDKRLNECKLSQNFQRMMGGEGVRQADGADAAQKPLLASSTADDTADARGAKRQLQLLAPQHVVLHQQPSLQSSAVSKFVAVRKRFVKRLSTGCPAEAGGAQPTLSTGEELAPVTYPASWDMLLGPM